MLNFKNVQIFLKMYKFENLEMFRIQKFVLILKFIPI
jgi:hypothetical protein